MFRRTAEPRPAPNPIAAGLAGFALNDAVAALRDTAVARIADHLVVHVTGGPAFGADIANSFSGANFTLLAVTAAVVALLLIVTYRSPILWLVPLTVIALADRTAAWCSAASSPALTGLDRRRLHHRASPACWCSARAPTTRCC